MVSLDAWRCPNADAVQPSYREATNPAAGFGNRRRPVTPSRLFLVRGVGFVQQAFDMRPLLTIAIGGREFLQPLGDGHCPLVPQHAARQAHFLLPAPFEGHPPLLVQPFSHIGKALFHPAVADLRPVAALEARRRRRVNRQVGKRAERDNGRNNLLRISPHLRAGRRTAPARCRPQAFYWRPLPF